MKDFLKRILIKTHVYGSSVGSGKAAFWLLNRILDNKRARLENLPIPMPTVREKGAVAPLIFSTSDIMGGASKLAWWLHNGLRGRGEQSSMFVGWKYTDDKDVHVIRKALKDRMFAPVCDNVGMHYYNNLSTFDLPDMEAFRKADVLNFHNLHGNYFNPLAVPGLTRLKPAVWSLHDMQSLTGNCAYSFSCEKWRDGCVNCEALGAYPALKADTTAEMFNVKKRIYEESDFDVVVTSNWLGNIVKGSILGAKRLHLIHYGIDTSVLRPSAKDEARARMGIPQDARVLIATIHGMSNQRKGGQYLLEALGKLAQDGTQVTMIAVGVDEGFDPGIRGIKWICTGYIDDEGERARLYSAADVLLMPTLADNFPLVVLEAMACGLPVVAFSTGGVPEQVVHKVTGYVAGYKDVDDFVAGVRYFLEDSSRIKEASALAIKRVRENFTLDIMVDGYVELYKEVIERRTVKGRAK